MACMIAILVNRYRRIKRSIPQHTIDRLKRYWLSIAFVLGFIVDNITLNNVEQVFDNVVLFSYVVISMASIAVMYAALAGRFPDEWNDRLRTYAPLAVQFSFGGLLSGMLIFYGRSGAWAESWPFLLIIILVILGNETITKRSSRFFFNIGILFIGLFLYTVLVIPVLTGLMGSGIFLASGALALFVMYGFIRILRRIIPNFIRLHLRYIIFLIGSMFVALNALYFTNIIPPIPLSLKDVGIYHSVVRFDDGTYELTYEEGEWWQPFKKSDNVFHPVESDAVHCFASVFAPTRLSIDVFHRWEYYNEEAKEWVEHARLSYPISGGRQDGYRGYTLISNYQDGKWRCSVETNRGQVLGRETFRIDSSEEPAPLVTREE